MSHTKEPWVIDGDERHPDGSGAFISAYFSQPDGGRIGKTFFNCGIDEEMCRANARRIVACVNACAGIETPTLEGLSLRKMADDYRSAMRQRNELLAALKATRVTLERANIHYVIADTLWHTEHETLFDFIDVAIEKAEAEQSKVK